MRLLTHNMLHCPRTKIYPLHLQADTCDDVTAPYSEAFIRRMIPRLDWGVFIEAATQFPDADMKNMLPNDAPEGDDVEEEVLRAIHRALLEWHVVSGTLTAEGGGVYQVTNGIPNLVITEVRAKEGGEEEVVGNGEGEGEQEREQGAGGMEVEEQSAA